MRRSNRHRAACGSRSWSVHSSVHYHISPIGLVPKKEAGKFRLIHDLSFPKGSAVNDGIPTDFRSVQYELLDNAIAYIARQGHNASISKILDIKSAFRLCPVRTIGVYLVLAGIINYTLIRCSPWA
jgi:hypothetical protein